MSFNLKWYWLNLFLEAKASKGMHQVCIKKSPDSHLSIHPRWKQFHWLNTSILWGFLYNINPWYCSILFILNQFGHLWIKKFYYFKCILQSFKLSLLRFLRALIINFVCCKIAVREKGLMRLNWLLKLIRIKRSVQSKAKCLYIFANTQNSSFW